MSELKAVTKQEQNIVDITTVRIKELVNAKDIELPKNYSYSNALKSALLMLQETLDKNKKPVLQTCSNASISNALLDMCIQGLNPARKQCYFIPYDGKLQLSKSYLGNIAVTKRLPGVKNVVANVIYKDDIFKYEFDLETGLARIAEHTQEFKNIDMKNIIGAYAIVLMDKGPHYIEIMTMEQIRNAWLQGSAYASGKSTAHKNFTDEMCKKTVINRACKRFACTCDDADLTLIESVMNTGAYDDEQKSDATDEAYHEEQNEIHDNANKEIIDVESSEPTPTPKKDDSVPFM